MVTSMTGFAQISFEAVWGTLIWELRTVNHRFLEIGVRLPENMRPWEGKIREHIQKVVTRGKVDATLKFIPGGEVAVDFIINEPLLEQLSQASAIVQKFFPNTLVNSLDVLSWSGVLEVQPANTEDKAAAVFRLLDETLAHLLLARRREGANVKTFLQMCLQKVHEFVKVIHQYLPRIREESREKIKARFAELSLEVNSERLEQEMLWLLQKMDVAEEIQRLQSHLQEVARILESELVMGRRLDFLMQELNREANTMGSKSLNSEVTQLIVEIKVLIEQMREQVQNIE